VSLTPLRGSRQAVAFRCCCDQHSKLGNKCNKCGPHLTDELGARVCHVVAADDDPLGRNSSAIDATPRFLYIKNDFNKKKKRRKKPSLADASTYSLRGQGRNFNRDPHI